MEKNKSLKNKIISQIKKGDIHMRPKIHFTLLTILTVVGMVLFAFALIYFISFTSFVFKINNIWDLSGFGVRGIMPFLHSLPWLLLVLILVFLATLEILTQYFSFSHRVPLVYTLLAIVTMGVLGSFIMATNSFHDHVLVKVKDGEAPFVGMMYSRYSQSQSDKVFRAVVVDVEASSLNVILNTGDTVKVLLTEETYTPGNSTISSDVDIMIVGERDGDVIHASAVKSVRYYHGNEPKNEKMNYKDGLLPNRGEGGGQAARVLIDVEAL